MASDVTETQRSAFGELAALAPLRVWDGILARTVEGERVTFAVIELDPGMEVPEHRHHNEQVGVCVAGSIAFRVGPEARELKPGDTWTIPAYTPHGTTAGPEGAVVVEAFSPARDDWEGLERLSPRTPRWPG